MIGVSPAFFLSLYREDFTLEDCGRALSLSAGLGFGGFQLEVFKKEELVRWRGRGTRELAARSRELGLRATQFVAHCLLPDFSSAAGLKGEGGREEVERIIEIVAPFASCRLITLPLGPFSVDWSEDGAGRSSFYRFLLERLSEKLARILEALEGADLCLALEILPRALVSGSEGFLRLREALGSKRLGFNFDTGHAWACKEEVALLPFKLEGKIFGTHLRDNFGGEDLALRPGLGSIPWAPLLKNLKASGYKGSLDLEIRCRPEEVEKEYGGGLAFIRSLGGRRDHGS